MTYFSEEDLSTVPFLVSTEAFLDSPELLLLFFSDFSEKEELLGLRLSLKDETYFFILLTLCAALAACIVSII
jgi:hypothetical protein